MMSPSSKYISHYLIIISLFISTGLRSISGKCTINIKHEERSIIACSNITVEEYISEVFSNIGQTFRVPPEGRAFAVSIEIEDSFLPAVDEWLFYPLTNRFTSVDSVRIVNSSVQNMVVKHLSKFSAIQNLDLSGNNISDFTFLNHIRNLRHLYLENNTLIKGSNLQKYLESRSRPLELISLKNCMLEEFEVSSNVVHVYDLSFNLNLTTIFLKLSRMSNSPLIRLNSNRNDEIKFLRKHREVESACISIDMSNSQGDFNHTLFSDICITKLFLRDCKIPSLSRNGFNLRNIKTPSDHFSLAILDLSYTGLTEISSDMLSFAKFAELNLSFNNLSNISDSLFARSTIIDLNIANSNVSFISPEAFSNLFVGGTLDLSSNNITSLVGIFSHILSVSAIDLSYNPIEVLHEGDFQNCKDLNSVKLSNVFVSRFEGNPFAVISTLNSLTLSFDSSIDSNSVSNVHLSELIIENSTLVKLHADQFKGFYKLKRLLFRKSIASFIDKAAFQGLFNLRRIYMLNELGSYDINVFQPLSSLDHLDLSSHDIKKLGLELNGLYSLKKLNLSLNAIESVDVNSFKTMKNLEIVSLAHNKISGLTVGTFNDLSKLSHLYLSNNQLQQLAPGLFSGLTNMVLLDLSRNSLLRIKPHLVFGISMPRLKRLHLQNNQLGNEYAKGDELARRSEFSVIANHNSLEFIDINENGWHCTTLIDVLIAFKNRNISYKPANLNYLANNINGVTCT